MRGHRAPLAGMRASTEHRQGPILATCWADRTVSLSTKDPQLGFESSHPVSKGQMEGRQAAKLAVEPSGFLPYPACLPLQLPLSSAAHREAWEGVLFFQQEGQLQGSQETRFLMDP